MSEPEILSVDDDLDWQRDAAVGQLGEPEVIEEGNRQGATVDVDDDEDSGL